MTIRLLRNDVQSEVTTSTNDVHNVYRQCVAELRSILIESNIDPEAISLVCPTIAMIGLSQLLIKNSSELDEISSHAMAAVFFFDAHARAIDAICDDREASTALKAQLAHAASLLLTKAWIYVIGCKPTKSTMSRIEVRLRNSSIADRAEDSPISGNVEYVLILFDLLSSSADANCAALRAGLKLIRLLDDLCDFEDDRANGNKNVLVVSHECDSIVLNRMRIVISDARILTKALLQYVGKEHVLHIQLSEFADGLDTVQHRTDLVTPEELSRIVKKIMPLVAGY